jgi:ABC-type transport system involved in cytochrome bd biosynthesis fused ATPase/permease subunit
MNQETENDLVNNDTQKPERKSIEDQPGYFATFLPFMYSVLILSIFMDTALLSNSFNSLAVLMIEIGLFLLTRNLSVHIHYLSIPQQLQPMGQMMISRQIKYRLLILIGYVALTILAVTTMETTTLKYVSFYKGIQMGTIVPFSISTYQWFKYGKKFFPYLKV